MAPQQPLLNRASSNAPPVGSVTAAGVTAAASGSGDDSLLCRTTADVYTLPARLTLGLLLRAYLDQQRLTVSELLHSYPRLKPLLEQKSLCDTVLTRLAGAQAPRLGQTAAERRLGLQALTEGVVRRARAAEAALAEFPRGGNTVACWLEANPGAGPGTSPDAGPLAPEPAAGLRAAVFRELAAIRTWSGKLDYLLELSWRYPDARIAAAVDQGVADLLTTAGALREVLNTPPSLGVKLTRLFDLIRGEMLVEAGPNGVALSGKLNALFRQGRLPEAAAAGLDRIRRRLKGSEPLFPGQREGENALVARLLGQMVAAEGVVGGPGMAEALVLRTARRWEQGGSSGIRRALDTLSEMVPDLIARLQLLLAFAASDSGRRQLGDVVRAVEAAASNELLLEGLVLRSPNLLRSRYLLEGLLASVAVLELAPTLEITLMRKLRTAVDEFALSGGLFQRLTQAEPSAARRALRLTELIESGLLLEDGGLVPARRALVDLLSQPGIDAELARLRQPPTTGRPAAPSGPPPTAGVTRIGPPAPDDQATLLEPAPDSRTLVTPLPAAGGPLPPPSLPRVAAGPGTAVMPPTQPLPLTALPVSAPPVALGPRECCPACFAPRTLEPVCPACGHQDAGTRPGPHLPLGTVLLGRYVVGKVLGQGGFGATYLGFDQRLEIKVAIKEFFPVSLVSRMPGETGLVPYTDDHAGTFRQGMTKFLDEARLLARLREVKEIVAVQDFFETNTTAYLVMELLQGRTLRKLINESGGTIECRRALGLLTPIMKALHAVHEAGLIHRDVAPDNIFITTTGERKLLDFGAARQTAGDGAGLMTVILKPGYAPPEQYFQDKRQGPWTDVYALAATIYCVLTGKPPPDATRRLQEDSLTPPSAQGVTLPPAFEQALLSALALKVAERPQSIRAFHSALSSALA